MKLPVSQIKSEDLESLFQKSSIMEQYFFPRTVPSVPHLDSYANKKASYPYIKIPSQNNEKSVEKN